MKPEYTVPVLLASVTAGYFAWQQLQRWRASRADPMDPDNWRILWSINMPERPKRHPQGWCIELPQPTAEAGSLHYVVMPCGSLKGKSAILMTYFIETDEPGVKLLPRRFPDAEATLSLHFKRRGKEDDGYRWWAATHPVTPGGHTVGASLRSYWTSVQSLTTTSSPDSFSKALSGAEFVGFTLGGGDGKGHGVYATGPARLVVAGFRVE